jgi:hypothetical protein
VSLFFSILASTFKFSLLGIDADPDRLDSDRHALDAVVNPDQDPAKLCGSFRADLDPDPQHWIIQW